MNGLHALGTEPVSRIRNLKKRFGQQTILADASFPDSVFTVVAVPEKYR